MQDVRKSKQTGQTARVRVLSVPCPRQNANVPRILPRNKEPPSLRGMEGPDSDLDVTIGFTKAGQGGYCRSPDLCSPARCFPATTVRCMTIEKGYHSEYRTLPTVASKRGRRKNHRFTRQAFGSTVSTRSRSFTRIGLGQATKQQQKPTQRQEQYGTRVAHSSRLLPLLNRTSARLFCVGIYLL